MALKKDFHDSITKCFIGNRHLIVDDIFSLVLSVVSRTASITSEVNRRVLRCQVALSTSRPSLVLVYQNKLIKNETFHYHDRNVGTTVLFSKENTPLRMSFELHCPVFYYPTCSAADGSLLELKTEQPSDEVVPPNGHSLLEPSNISGKRMTDANNDLSSLWMLDDIFSIALGILKGTVSISCVTNRNSVECQIYASPTEPVLILVYTNVLQVADDDGALGPPSTLATPPPLLSANADGIPFYRKMFCTVTEKRERETSHLGNKSYKCKYCEKRFTRTRAVKEHERSHVGERPYKCTLCEKTFSRYGVLKRHQKTHTGVKPFQCNHCDKRFYQQAAVKVHERSHTGEKPLRCRFCERGFAWYGNLKQHEKIHTGEKPFKCTFCEKSFSRANIRKQHERIHTGDKPYPCKFCGKCFSRTGDVKLHEKTHTGEELHKCRFCEKTFTHAAPARIHERTHTGEKPYKCKHCEKPFSSSAYAKLHERMHTGERPYKCLFCEKAFCSSADARYHERFHARSCNSGERTSALNDSEQTFKKNIPGNHMSKK